MEGEERFGHGIKGDQDRKWSLENRRNCVAGSDDFWEERSGRKLFTRSSLDEMLLGLSRPQHLDSRQSRRQGGGGEIWRGLGDEARQRDQPSFLGPPAVRYPFLRTFRPSTFSNRAYNGNPPPLAMSRDVLPCISIGSEFSLWASPDLMVYGSDP